MSAWADGWNDWLNRSGDLETDGEQSGTNATTGGSGDQEPVVVWKAANEMEAQIVKGRLISEDIPAFLRGESLGTIYGLTAGRLASTDVLVPGPLAEKAQQILDSAPEWQDAEWEDETLDSES